MYSMNISSAWDSWRLRLLEAWGLCWTPDLTAAAAFLERGGERERSGREEATISPERFGEIRWETSRGWVGVGEGKSFCLEDLFEHLVCFGGSGTGKTYSVLQPLWEEFFRSTHLPTGEERQRRKFGALVIEAKGDFREKTWFLAKKYGRTGDVLYFGPSHPGVVYDPFGDPTESAMQLASKMLELMRAASGGRQGEDPFWDNAARKLFLHVFLLHRALRDGSHAADDAGVPLMSFPLLNLILMDRGTPRNQAALEHSAEHVRELWREQRAAAEELAARSIDAELSSVQIPTPDGEPSLPVQCERLRSTLRMLAVASDESARVENGNRAAGATFDLAHAFRSLPPEHAAVFTPFVAAAERFLHAREAALAFRPDPPVYGALKGLLNRYRTMMEARGEPIESDAIWSYFHEEYLNPANEKTSGSVAMTASNIVAPLAHPPFSRILGPDPSFTFADVIDEGKIVYLDMPSADYKKAAEVVALVMKMDFFRAMLRRPRLRNRGGTRVNAERPMVYFCDEFATVASSGDDTGEAAFMDKVREYRCACLLGIQSLAMLHRRLPPDEVDALMTNVAIKVFMNNTDPRTNEYAAKMLGTEIKVHGSLSPESGLRNGFPGARDFQTHHTREDRVRPSDIARLRRGEAYVRLNPRFDRHQVQRVQFSGRAITDPDGGRGRPVPGEGAG